MMTIGPRRLALVALMGIALLPGGRARAQQSDGSGIVTGDFDDDGSMDLLVVRAGPGSDPPARAASDSTPRPATPPGGGKLEGSSMRLIESRNHCIRCHAVDTSKRLFANAEGGVINQLIGDFVSAPEAHDLGATLEQADRAVRAQLGLPDDRGLVLWSLTPDGPAARAGLQANDILLTLDDKPLGRPQDFSARLKEAGDKAVPLALIREGKPITIRVKPEYRVSFTAVQPEKTEYSIGVRVKPIDTALREHLPTLADRPGLVVAVVEPDSPAAKAGLKVADILLAVGDVPVSDFDSLVARIQATGGKPVPLQVLRAGKPMTIEVTPALKGQDPARELALNEVLVCPGLNTQVAWSKAPVAYDPLWVLPPHMTLGWDTWSKTPTPSNQPHPREADSDRVEKRLDALTRELKQLQESIEALQKSLKPGGERK